MKIVIITLCMALGVLAQEQYEAVSAEFNISEILQNERLLKSYVKCLINQGPCTADVKKLKDNLPEALATRCAKCTEQHKQIGKQLVKEVKSKHTDLWKQLVAFYDPEGKYQEAWQDFLKE